jgi:hypothetical protein
MIVAVRVGRVAQTIAHNRKGEHRDHNENRWNEQPWCLLDHPYRLGLLEQNTP